MASIKAKGDSRKDVMTRKIRFNKSWRQDVSNVSEVQTILTKRGGQVSLPGPKTVLYPTSRINCWRVESCSVGESFKLF